MPDTAFFEANVFMYEVLAERMPGVEIQRVAEVVAVPDARDRVLAADYVVAKSGDQGSSWVIHDTPTLTAELCGGRGQPGRLFEKLGLSPPRRIEGLPLPPPR